MNATTKTTIFSLDFRQLRAVLLDMDGVLWRGSQIIPGAPEFIRFLHDRHIVVGLASNNSSRAPAEAAERCRRAGIEVDVEHIIWSGIVTADEMARTYPSGTPIYVVGSPTLIGILDERGYPMVADPKEVRVVIVGYDSSVNYQKLTIGLRCLLNGADFIGTNADPTFPATDGLAPGAGSLIAALETASGRKARIMGKPAAAMFRAALARLGTEAAHTLMIGDRLDTDILGAQQAGLPAALVLTGVTTRAELDAPGQSIKPDGVFDDLIALQTAWNQTSSATNTVPTP